MEQPAAELLFFQFDDRLKQKCCICKRWFTCDEERLQLTDKSFCHALEADRTCTEMVEGKVCRKAEFGEPTPITVSIFWPAIVRLVKEQDDFFSKKIENEIYSPLMAACHSGNCEIVEWLVQIKGHNVNERSDPEGFTPLMAVCTGASEIVRVEGFTPEIAGRYVAVFKFLVAAGADLHASTYAEGWTAHMSARGVRELHELFCGGGDDKYEKYFRQVYLNEDCGLRIYGSGGFSS
jgi:hypothetical protein